MRICQTQTAVYLIQADIEYYYGYESRFLGL